MTKKEIVISATLLFAASLPWQANANTINFGFIGPGVSGTVALTYGGATDAKYPQGFESTGISGTFSDSNHGLNIVNATIGSLEPIRHDSPEPTNLLAPHDFTRFAVMSGLPPDSNGFVTYDNLYYPGGSPPTATDYPAQGGFLDIYGLGFDIGGGRVVNFWSNGSFNPTFAGPFDYGVSVSTQAVSLDYVTAGVTATPEPGAFALLGSGLLGMLVWRRRAARQS